MKYYLDCEFDGPELLSLALVSESGSELYLTAHHRTADAPWVQENVCSIIDLPGMDSKPLTSAKSELESYFAGDRSPEIIADWPTDFQHFLPMVHDDMGNMINMPSFTCSVKRVDAYPTQLKGAVQHNALWDARALRHLLEAA